LLPASVTAADRLLDCPAGLGRVARSVRQRSINSVDKSAAFGLPVAYMIIEKTKEKHPDH
jgi:hypothetical protein